MNNTLSATNNNKALYRTLWRWHFYAGVFAIPFVILLSLTGAIYLFKPYYEHWQERDYRGLQVTGEALAPNDQISAALAAVDGGKLLSYRLPQAADEAVLISVQADTVWRVFVNPYTGEVLTKFRSDEQLMNIVKTIHGELLLGNVGSILVELAACWAIVLIITGLYLWWPRNARGMAGVIYPRLRDGSRTFWRDIHAVTGIWISACALFLLVSGLPWALVWGSALKEVRAIDFSQIVQAEQQQDWTQTSHQEHQSWRAQASDVFNLTPEVLAAADAKTTGGTVFGYHVSDPERYGVVAFDGQGNVTALVEKPDVPPSSFAVTGLDVLDGRAPELAAPVKPSPRGELEIVDLLEAYRLEGSLRVERMGRGFAWLDTGTHDSLMEASHFVQTIEARQGLKVACLEEIAYNQGWLSAAQLAREAEALSKTGYGQYLKRLLRQEEGQ